MQVLPTELLRYIGNSLTPTLPQVRQLFLSTYPAMAHIISTISTIVRQEKNSNTTLVKRLLRTSFAQEGIEKALYQIVSRDMVDSDSVAIGNLYKLDPLENIQVLDIDILYVMMARIYINYYSSFNNIRGCVVLSPRSILLMTVTIDNLICYRVVDTTCIKGSGIGVLFSLVRRRCDSSSTS